MLTLTANAEEFKTGKRNVLEEAEATLNNVVIEALADYGKLRWYAPILDAAVKLFDATYEQEAGEAPTPKSNAGLRKALTTSLAKTKTPGRHTAERIRNLVASKTVNYAFQSAAEDDPEELELEWVTMHDDRVRATHKEADGQRRQVGEPFHIGESEMDHPGDTSAPPEEWAGCRCLVRPTKPERALTAAGPPGMDTLPTVIVALPADADPVHGLGPEQSHCTMLMLGTDISNDDIANVRAAVRNVADDGPGPATLPVTGREALGDDNADVLMLDRDPLLEHRGALLEDPTVARLFAANDQYPEWKAHVTLGYPGADHDPAAVTDLPEQISFDRLALWHGDDQTEYPLQGDPMTAPTEEQATEAPAEEAPPTDLAVPGPIPWHGTIVVEGADAGDGRSFAKGSLRNRELPLPLTWQKASAEGHDGSVVVGLIQGLSRIDGEQDNPNLVNAYGVFRQVPEADEAVGLLTDFGKYGVSIDADDSTYEIDDSDPARKKVAFTDARVCSASMVSIPAFAEAYIRLGEAPEGFMGDSPDAEADPNAPLQLAAGTVEMGRGPGWVTDPEDTNRIHSYWTTPGQPGYEKIAWGTGGDFDRCRLEVGKYLAADGEARFINQTCAQWHFDALGEWPATHAKQLGKHSLGDTKAPMLNLVASGGWKPKAEWFSDLALTAPTRTTYVEHPEGTEVFGHLAEFDVCHLGMPGVCTVAPHNVDGRYRLFHELGGGVMTDKGLVNTGVLTLGGGHADTHLGLQAAMAHYDSTSTVVVDCRVGEDQFGIWFHGWVRPSATEQQKFEFRAAKLSGDWRYVNGAQELMLAHAVNLAGFHISPKGTTVDGIQVGLVAAGVLSDNAVQLGVDDALNTMLSDAVAAGIKAYEEGRARTAQLASITRKRGLDAEAKAARLREKHEGRKH